MRCPCFGEITLLAGATRHQAAMAGDRYKVAMHAIYLRALSCARAVVDTLDRAVARAGAAGPGGRLLQRSPA